jgi:uncharacterized protein
MSRAGTIDGRQFARDRGSLSGTLTIDDLPRLREFGCTAATLRYIVRGAADPNEHARLTVAVSGQLELVCQRCLAPLELPLALENELTLAGSEEEIDAAEDDVDRVLATPTMDVATVVEDEVIIALPMVAVHERCESNIGRDEQSASTSPFAKLATLRKGQQR